nr:MAG TPA: hypothetical protein [Caudoviricetes sp.]
MKPIDFKQSTKVLQRSADMTDDECSSLPVWSDGMQCVSCWKPSLSERISLVFGGQVWLGVASGGTQPPVFLSGKNVFKGASAFTRVRSLVVYMSERISGIRRAFAHMERHPYDEYRFSGKMVYSFVATIIGCVLGSLAYSLAVKLWHIIIQ